MCDTELHNLFLFQERAEERIEESVWIHCADVLRPLSLLHGKRHDQRQDNWFYFMFFNVGLKAKGRLMLI